MGSDTHFETALSPLGFAHEQSVGVYGKAKDRMTEFYAAAATLVGVFVCLNAALGNRVGLYYALLFAVMLALVWVL